MKKLLLLFYVFGTVLASPSPVSADELSDILQRLDSDVSVHNSLITSLEQDDYLNLQRQITVARVHYSESVTFYHSKIASAEDGELRGILIAIRDSVDGMGDSLAAMELSIELEDEQGLEEAATAYDSYIERFNNAIDELNSYYGLVDTSDYGLMLGWSLAISFLISAYLFVISRGHPLLPAEQLRNEFEAALFKSSLWPLAGSAVSYVWLLATPPGGTFYVFWGPIVFGYFYFAKGLYEYFRYSRPAINLAKQQQGERLQGLLSSDKFHKEGLIDKVKDIQSLEPTPAPTSKRKGSR